MPILNEISNKIKSNLKQAYCYLLSHWIKMIFQLIYLTLLVVIAVNILQFSYKAWLYPIRTRQYYDECSYISMAKYFKIHSPLSLLKDYLRHGKEIPHLYHEFNSRLIYGSILLSRPISQSNDRIFLHEKRALFLTLGTLIFFCLGFKLGGITGAVLISAFWIGTPIINYWGHFFMTEIPSFIFIALGILCLLYSDRFSLATLGGGLCLGAAAMIRFTTLVLIFPAPFILLALYLKPLKKRAYPILKHFFLLGVGFLLAVLPYLYFITKLYNNPLLPFLSARHNVNFFPVNDPDYYMNNLWHEGGQYLKIGVTLALAAPLIYGLIQVLAKKMSFYLENQTAHKKNYFTYLAVYLRAAASYALIIISLAATSSLYLIEVGQIPHKIARYILGGIIPQLIIAAIGFGIFELLSISLFQSGVFFLNQTINQKLASLFKWKQNRTLKPASYSPVHQQAFSRVKPSLFFIIWLALLLPGSFILPQLVKTIWQKTMHRPFTTQYQVHESVHEIKNETTVKRLQPEYQQWKTSINQRVQAVASHPDTALDQTQYLSDQYVMLYQYLNENMKADEVLYVDERSKLPFTPAYVNGICIKIENGYNHSLAYLIRSKELFYKGYVFVYHNPEIESFVYKGKQYQRSINYQAVKNNPRFQFVKKIRHISLFYYQGQAGYPTQNLNSSAPDLAANKSLQEQASPFEWIKKLVYAWKNLF